jgi:penicillin V acylase-like amidase (Ntn superfamily)
VSPVSWARAKAFFGVHVIVMDEGHQVWVMEFTNKTTNPNGFVWKNATKWGVVTNEPQYEEQIANLGVPRQYEHYESYAEASGYALWR